jgi:phosphatidylserine/phosphatidylglycerophosphate/cardiolipin synthase-like enzyme
MIGVVVRRLIASLLLLLAVPAFPTDLMLKNAPAQVYFSPSGGCTDAIVATIDNAKKSIRVLAYSFTSAPIAGALKSAHDRGVDVRVILDKSQRTERYSGMTFLIHAGIPTRIDVVHAIAHNKVMVIDGETVITGSFNFTKAAESKNAENLLIIQDPGLAKLYQANWEKLREQSEE